VELHGEHGVVRWGEAVCPPRWNGHRRTRLDVVYVIRVIFEDEVNTARANYKVPPDPFSGPVRRQQFRGDRLRGELGGGACQDQSIREWVGGGDRVGASHRSGTGDRTGWCRLRCRTGRWVGLARWNRQQAECGDHHEHRQSDQRPPAVERMTTVGS